MWQVQLDDGATQRWHLYDSGGAGRPILFVHGAPECGYTWHAQLEALAPHRRVIAVDLPGFGRLAEVNGPEGAYSADRTAEGLLALVDALDADTVDLVGHDWGAALASYVAGTQPERVDRFVRMEAPVQTFDLTNTPWWVVMSDPVLGPQYVAQLQALDPTAAIPPEDVLPVDELAGYDAHCLTPERFEAWRRYFYDTPYTELMGRMPELVQAMDLPVLLLQADGDEGQPLAYFDEDIDLFPDATLQVIRNSGHFTHIEQPEQVNAAITAWLVDE